MSGLGLGRLFKHVAIRVFEIPTYDPRRQGIFDRAAERTVPIDSFVVPAGQSIYDPGVFGRYDLASQRVVPKGCGAERPFHLDLVAPAAQRYRSQGAVLEGDRYRVALSWLPPGRGICLDACSSHPRPDVIERVSAAGYEYLPVDLQPIDGVRQEDLTRLTFEDESISCVLSVDTLEHIPDFRAAISEIFRVLQPRGTAIFHVPCYYFDKPTGEPIGSGIDPWGHVRYFSARELMASYEAAGLVNLRTTFIFDYGAVLSAVAKPA
jgi:SAM-dependent methyltransferase